MKQTTALSILMIILSGALARAEDATPKYSQAELNASPYLKSVVTREGTMADTSKFKKKGPIRLRSPRRGRPTRGLRCSTRKPATTLISSARTRSQRCSTPAPTAAPTSRSRKSRTC